MFHEPSHTHRTLPSNMFTNAKTAHLIRMKPTRRRVQLTLKYVTAPVFAFALATSFFAHPGLAQTNPGATKPSPAASTKPEAEVPSLLKFSQAGNTAMREIRGARLAIFNGDPKSATELLGKAKAAIAEAEKEAPTFDVKTTMSVQGKVVDKEGTPQKAEAVPVDGQLVLADNFVVTPEKQAHIDKANGHFKKGEHTQALEQLRQGEIDVRYTRLWMPLAPAQKHLDEAIALADDHKYYEANLALKAIEDGVTVDSVTLTELPKQPKS